jgi:hypothetical protein
VVESGIRVIVSVPKFILVTLTLFTAVWKVVMYLLDSR